MNIGLIFAGGIGVRMGSETPKQFLEWNGKAIIIHTLNVFDKHPNIDEIVIACKEEWIGYTKELINREGIQKVVSVIPGGTTALNSQLNGLHEIKRLHPQSVIAVLIHDGVRPLVDANTIQRNIDSVWKYGNAITVTKAIETVITIDRNSSVQKILNRDQCCMAKAPQSFKLDDIIEVHERAIIEGKHDFIDSASMMYHYGHTLHTVMGEPENIKVTTPSDYYMFLGISKNRKVTEENTIMILN
ncbi:MAG: 2-C-methyl-D-erythritol 4-phosphate cytidylyltransferase [Clostridiales bacterium]|nr:2-C-methyl-D-erythritol 4-phosphate cytidylyltransferase [Clostridiales bacterium]